MRRILTAALAAALIGLWCAPAIAACTVTTVYLPDGRTLVCTTCCSGAFCTTNCI